MFVTKQMRQSSSSFFLKSRSKSQNMKKILESTTLAMIAQTKKKNCEFLPYQQFKYEPKRKVRFNTFKGKDFYEGWNNQNFENNQISKLQQVQLIKFGQNTSIQKQSIQDLLEISEDQISPIKQIKQSSILSKPINFFAKSKIRKKNSLYPYSFLKEQNTVAHRLKTEPIISELQKVDNFSKFESFDQLQKIVNRCNRDNKEYPCFIYPFFNYHSEYKPTKIKRYHKSGDLRQRYSKYKRYKCKNEMLKSQNKSLELLMNNYQQNRKKQSMVYFNQQQPKSIDQLKSKKLIKIICQDSKDYQDNLLIDSSKNQINSLQQINKFLRPKKNYYFKQMNKISINVGGFKNSINYKFNNCNKLQ